MIRLSKNFTLQELCESETAKSYNILNHPAEDCILVELTALCHMVLQPLRAAFGPIRINSGYRCKMLNALVGGKVDSQHTKGQAADIFVNNDRARAEEIVNFIKSHAIPVDQAIIEHDKKGALWLHVSHRADGQNRGNFILNYEKK